MVHGSRRNPAHVFVMFTQESTVTDHSQWSTWPGNQRVSQAKHSSWRNVFPFGQTLAIVCCIVISWFMVKPVHVGGPMRFYWLVTASPSQLVWGLCDGSTVMKLACDTFSLRDTWLYKYIRMHNTKTVTISFFSSVGIWRDFHAVVFVLCLPIYSKMTMNFFFVALRIELWTSCLPGRYCITELYPRPLWVWILYQWYHDRYLTLYQSINGLWTKRLRMYVAWSNY